MLMRKAFAAAVFSIVLFSTRAPAATQLRNGIFGGLRIDYKVLVPENYDPAREYPVVLAFAGGSGDMPIVDNGLARYWGLESRKRGYIVVSPAAPPGQLFFQGGAKVFPEVLDMIVHDYKPRGGKIHVAGFSNGGITAFYAASHYPKYFWSVTGLPGLLEDATEPLIEALRPMCIDMLVGGNDSGWRANMERQSKMFQKRGYTVDFHVIEGQNHFMSLGEEGNARLFNFLDKSAHGCSK